MSDSFNNLENPLESDILSEENLEISQTTRDNIRDDFTTALIDMQTLLNVGNSELPRDCQDEMKKICTMIFMELFRKVNLTIDRDAEQKKNSIKGAIKKYDVVLEKTSRELDDTERYMDYLETTTKQDLTMTMTLLEQQENFVENITGEVDLLMRKYGISNT
ncbi:hypothetical protein JTB14_014404 [Gonioctena quinquepunctata]|nr:hypothetical protein JTB14_014404 [Gonioctena quinquepunctata]